MNFSVLVVLLALSGAWAHEARFDNHKVYRMIPRNVQQLSALREIDESFDIWREPTAVNIPVDVLVPPEKTAEFLDFVNSIEIEAKPYIEDVQELIDESMPKTTTKSTDNSFGWTKYNTLSEINAWLDSLAKQYPDKVTVVVGGRSYEGRDIKGVKVSFKSGNKAVFIEGGIHAREWIAPATVTYILNELLTSSDPAVRDVAESYDWYVFPSFNPDGYEYTFTTNRLWRKTVQPHGACNGADPNRNWGYHWMNGGASSNPCWETFAGPKAFSEPETKSLSEYITTIADDLVGYIAFHSFSQFLLIPYGDSNAHVENYDELMEIGLKAKRSLAKRYGTNYRVGNIVDIIYVASGGSMDWVKGTFHTPITYTYELRDTGRYGFLLPPSQILPTGLETLDSFVTIFQEAKKRGY